MTTHYKACVEAYREFYRAAQEMPAATQAAFDELRKSKLGNFEIQDLVAPFAGKALGSLPGFKEMIDKAIAQKPPCGESIIEPALKILMAQKVPGDLRKAMKQNVRDLEKAAKRFNPPI